MIDNNGNIVSMKKPADKNTDGMDGDCTTEAQGITYPDESVIDFTGFVISMEKALMLRNHGVITKSEYEEAQKRRIEHGIPLLIPPKPQTSADKISELCDELRDYVLSKHNIEDVSEIREVCDMCHGLKKFLLVKNERYGDSALKPVKIFSKGGASDKIDIRMDDKMSRIIESDEQLMNDFVDLTGYLVLKCINKGWTDFSELLD